MQFPPFTTSVPAAMFLASETKPGAVNSEAARNGNDVMLGSTHLAPANDRWGTSFACPAKATIGSSTADVETVPQFRGAQ